uniref:Uncharacterized protein n=1 Tax=uncultured prokaryote TaxID=198431 RepID=A0A0H5QL70_9ZZZZ|nr:hypothetical protein [uncultured prokaryote]
MTILRVTAEWSGFEGGPGYTVFHFGGGGGVISDAAQVANRVRDGFDTLKSVLPNNLVIRVRPEVEEIDESTGMLTGYQGVEGLVQVSGASGGTYAAPVGAVVNWNTNDVRDGRRIRGRTFLVPLASGAFFTNGTVSSTTRTTLTAFADALTGTDFDSELVVWSRPKNGSGGVAASVTGYRVSPKAAVLRSRRD